MATHAGIESIGVHADTPVHGPRVGWLRRTAALLRGTRSSAGITTTASMTAPSTASTLPILARGERVLARDRDTDGSPVVATTLALYHHTGPAGGWSRLGWEDAGRVRWDPDRCQLVLTSLRADLPGTPAVSHVTLGLPRRSRLPALARERVGATLLTSSQVAVGGRVTAVVQARRRPDRWASDVTWVVLFNGAVNPQEPAVRDTVRRAIDRMRAELGL